MGVGWGSAKDDLQDTLVKETIRKRKPPSSPNQFIQYSDHELYQQRVKHCLLAIKDDLTTRIALIDNILNQEQEYYPGAIEDFRKHFGIDK